MSGIGGEPTLATMRRWVAGAGLALLVGCGASSDAGSDTTTTTSTTLPPSTVTLPPTTTVVPAAPQPTPGAAAEVVIAAWQAGDRSAALQVATAAAVDALFAIQATSVSARGCNQGGTDPSYCVYRTDVGELQLKLTVAGGGWIVADAFLGTG